MTITVYSKPGCGACVASKRALTMYGIPFQEVDFSRDPEALEYILGLGHTSAPVITVGDTGDHWSGFSLEKIQELSEQLAAV